MASKRCFRCGETKDLSEFYHHRGMRDGHLGKCKECTKRDVRANYRLKVQYYCEYYRARRQACSGES